ncbi:AI-2E family transporter [Microbacterium esteraromaticum]|uniref:AI-2E family transporter n=1 Tax=Microbacterium esteraromaticum TaxID=57043 RepID=A0A7D8A7T4_9MICO|nr:AI-2E family transporter [Microbacterium esteraromaticum]QMU96720.1 AI-2E family transporter [Microbacterium esteraromaticum]
MALFSSDRPRRVQLDPTTLDLRASRAPWSLWADGFGRLGIRSIQIIVTVAVAAGIVFVIQYLTLVTIPLAIALILACAFAPAMNWLRRRRVPDLPATIITLFAIVAVLSALSWLIVWAVRTQWDELYAQAQEGIDHLIDWTNTLPFQLFTPEQLEEWTKTLTDFVTSAQFGSGALAGVGAVASFVTGFVLLVTILFFFLKDGPQMWEFLLRPFRGESERRARRIGAKTVGVLGSYVRGTATVALVDAVGILIGLLILQVPLAIPLAVLVFLLAFIPIVGATLAGVLAALVALVANGWVNALLVVGVVVLVNQLEGNLLQPFLMGRTMKLHAFVILVALAVGTALSGLIGAVLAVPVTAAVWGIIQVWDGDDLPVRWARRKTREPEPAESTAVEIA